MTHLSLFSSPAGWLKRTEKPRAGSGPPGLPPLPFPGCGEIVRPPARVVEIRHDAAYEQAMGLGRQMARERDERYAQLRASEAEANRYRRALRDIAETRATGCGPTARRLVLMARRALEHSE